MDLLRNQTAHLLDFYRDENFSRFLRDTAIAFLVLIIGSFLLGLIVPSMAENVVSQFTQMLADAGIANETGRFSALSIFAQNLRAMLAAVLYGFIPYLFLSALVLGTNSMILGFVGAHYVNNGHSLLLYLAGILPHGIFELPALVLAITCGLYLCACVTRRIRTHAKGTLVPALIQILRVVIMQILPLLLVAALVEAYVTPVVLNVFM